MGLGQFPAVAPSGSALLCLFVRGREKIAAPHTLFIPRTVPGFPDDAHKGMSWKTRSGLGADVAARTEPHNIISRIFVDRRTLGPEPGDGFVLCGPGGV